MSNLRPMLFLALAIAATIVEGAGRYPDGFSTVTTAVLQGATATHNVAHQPVITKPPSLEDLRMRRDLTYEGNFLFAPDSVCGYIEGDPKSVWSCDTTEKCAFATDDGGFVACCGTECAHGQTACMDAVTYSAGLCKGDCETNSLIRKCTDTSLPYCATLTFFDGILDYACADVDSSVPVTAELTSNGYVGPLPSLSSVFIGQTTENIAASTTASTQGPPPSSSSSSASTSAIIGGAVGGSAAVALIAIGAWFFLRRKNKNIRNISSSNKSSSSSPSDDQPPKPPLSQTLNPDYSKAGYDAVPMSAAAHGSPSPPLTAGVLGSPGIQYHEMPGRQIDVYEAGGRELAPSPQPPLSSAYSSPGLSYGSPVSGFGQPYSPPLPLTGHQQQQQHAMMTGGSVELPAATEPRRDPVELQ